MEGRREYEQVLISILVYAPRARKSVPYNNTAFISLFTLRPAGKHDCAVSCAISPSLVIKWHSSIATRSTQ
jgi:hypothetical protein